MLPSSPSAAGINGRWKSLGASPAAGDDGRGGTHTVRATPFLLRLLKAIKSAASSTAFSSQIAQTESGIMCHLSWCCFVAFVCQRQIWKSGLKRSERQEEEYFSYRTFIKMIVISNASRGNKRWRLSAFRTFRVTDRMVNHCCHGYDSPGR